MEGLIVEITIKNCNSIDETKIELYADKLNIKYGMNGTGKSTIVKAIELAANNEEVDLSSLMPFKYLGKPETEIIKPSIEGLDSIDSVLVFDENYVDQIVFKQDEVVNNSFEIFIKTEKYDQKMKEIEKLVAEIKETFISNANIEQVIKDLTDLNDSFGKSKTGYSAAGRIGKGIGKGNKLEHIPESLISYEPFLKKTDNVKWIGWHMKGNEFLDTDTGCPYCIAPTTEEKKETILSVSKEYDAKSIEHLNKFIEILDNLGKYFNSETKEQIQTIAINKNGLSKDETAYLVEVKDHVVRLKDNLSSLKDLSFFSFKDDENIQNKVKGLKINLGLLSHVNSNDTKNIVDEINKSIDSVLVNIGLLQGEVHWQKREIKKNIKKHKNEINEFLKYAGYEYYVDVEKDGDSYKMRLKHKDFETSINNSSKHLSYGERNAFSLVLFMYECLSKKPDLIILDDPISSFDKNKKFAIVEMLFCRKNSFQGKMVLMMTHDFEPVIDIISTFHGRFQPIPHASFIKYNEGKVSEVEIKKNDIISFGQVCTENMQGQNEDIIKLIYLRRYYEILDDKGVEYQLLSNLLHKETTPISQPGNLVMTVESIEQATTSIKEKVAGFDYNNALSFVNDKDKMMLIYNQTNNNYEKLQIFRIVNELQHDSSVIKKFIDETFHIENEFIMQLNPSKYDFIPHYIISECDNMLAT
jgi:ABC-type Mn2+/Zn2+ transport system ATPase subunit